MNGACGVYLLIIEMQFTSRSRQKLVICRRLLYAVHIFSVSIVFLQAFFRIIVVPGAGGYNLFFQSLCV